MVIASTNAMRLIRLIRARCSMRMGNYGWRSIVLAGNFPDGAGSANRQAVAPMRLCFIWRESFHRGRVPGRHANILSLRQLGQCCSARTALRSPHGPRRQVTGPISTATAKVSRPARLGFLHSCGDSSPGHIGIVDDAAAAA